MSSTHEVIITAVSTHRYLIDADSPAAAEAAAQHRFLAGDDGDPAWLTTDIESVIAGTPR